VNLPLIFLQASLAEDVLYKCSYGSDAMDGFRVDRARGRIVSLAGDQEINIIKEKNGVIRFGSCQLDTRRKAMICGSWLLADVEATCTAR
jgi:hypothetical protein